MAAAIIEHFGSAWLERGAMDVRFFQPFYEGEQVAVSIPTRSRAESKSKLDRALRDRLDPRSTR